MICINHFFVLSPRGDRIISRDYRNESRLPPINSIAATFFEKLTLSKRKLPLPPIFLSQDLCYVYIERNELFFVLTSGKDLSPNLAIETLIRISDIFKDYCGVLNEESIRKNFVLLYELLDEMFDFGFLQNTNTENLKKAIYNKPVNSSSFSAASPSGLGINSLVEKMQNSLSMELEPSKQMQRKSGSAGQKSVFQEVSSNEIFVDIFENIQVLFNNDGFILSQAVNGYIQIKSFLQYKPVLKIGLNSDLAIGRDNVSASSSAVIDDISFHRVAKLHEFESSRVISFIPPEGEFSLVTYRSTSDFLAPFRISVRFVESSLTEITVFISVSGDFDASKTASNVILSYPIPSMEKIASISLKSGSLRAEERERENLEYKEKNDLLEWKIKRFKGGTERSFSAVIALKMDNMDGSVKKEFGPCFMKFEIPMFNVSGLVVKYLKIESSEKVQRWVRYLARSDSYVRR
eukprot:maker-scaffold_8-snap-gene-14.6-mRNA-1 protein AED:0.25 eAED:0.25 QI:25/1/1/1/1/1/2/74/462